MLTFPPQRRQGDLLGDVAAELTAVDTGENIARQDFREDTDINTILRRHGINGLGGDQRFQPMFTENDDSIDLQQTIEMQRAAQRAWNRLDAALKARYPSPAALFAAAEDGTLQLTLDEEPDNGESTSP